MKRKENSPFDMVMLFFEMSNDIKNYILSIGGEHTSSMLFSCINGIKNFTPYEQIDQFHPCFSKEFKASNDHYHAQVRYKYKGISYYIFYSSWDWDIVAAYTAINASKTTAQTAVEESIDNQMFKYSELFTASGIYEYDFIDGIHIDNKASMETVFTRLLDFTQKYFALLCEKMQNKQFVDVLQRQAVDIEEIQKNRRFSDLFNCKNGYELYVKGNYKWAIRCFERLDTRTPFENGLLQYMKDIISSGSVIQKQPYDFSDIRYKAEATKKRFLFDLKIIILIPGALGLFFVLLSLVMSLIK